MFWEYPPVEILIMSLFLIGISLILAWVCDFILESAGYGVFGNTFFIFTSALIGVFCLNAYGYELDQFPMFSFMTVSSVCFGLFLTTLIVKKAVH